MTRLKFVLVALTAIVSLAYLVPFAAQADSFVTGFEDLPLMPGLAPAADESVVFYNPSGRIVQAAARGKVTAAQVRAFYTETLPQLGWKVGGTDRFIRDGEALRLDFGRRSGAGAGDAIVVRFVLSPDK
ncbi:conserved exported hypothetical protein [uncultured Gammaproteobacteria bacterium]